MRVTMRAPLGLPSGEALQPGQVVDVEDRIGQAWVETGVAESAGKPPPRKKDSGPQPEAPSTETQQAPSTTAARKPKKTESE